jgi:hypothetical protein
MPDRQLPQRHSSSSWRQRPPSLPSLPPRHVQRAGRAYCRQRVRRLCSKRMVACWKQWARCVRVQCRLCRRRRCQLRTVPCRLPLCPWRTARCWRCSSVCPVPRCSDFGASQRSMQVRQHDIRCLGPCIRVGPTGWANAMVPTLPKQLLLCLGQVLWRRGGGGGHFIDISLFSCPCLAHFILQSTLAQQLLLPLPLFLPLFCCESIQARL